MKIITKTFTLLLSSLFLSQTLLSQTFNFTKVVNTSNPTGIMFDSNDTLWYIVQGDGLYEYDRSTSVSTNHSTGFVTNNVISCESGGTKKWVAGYGGLISYDGTPTNYSSSTGQLQGYTVYDVDVDGNDIWLAMESEGASNFNGSTWTHYTSSNGLLGDWFTAIEKDASGNIWLTSVDYSNSLGIVNKFNGTSWTSYSTAEGITLSSITSIYEDSNGNIWIGGNGVMKFDGTTWSSIPITPSNQIYAIMEDKYGNIWFGDLSFNLYMYDSNTVSNVNTPETFVGGGEGIVLDANDEIYFCLADGIYTVDYTPTNTNVSVNQIIQDSYTIFPNPTSGKININAKDMDYIIILDIQGVELYNGIETEIDLSKQPDGVYFIKMIKNNETIIQKIIKH